MIDDTNIQTVTVTDEMINQMNEELMDAIRNEEAITEADLLAMETAALHIDPEQCDKSPQGGRWCPRCGIGCCSIRKVDGEWVCSGGCDAHGHHHHTRVAPEVAAITDSSEALGVIDPATIPAFVALVEREHGRSDFLNINELGRVTVHEKHLPIGELEAFRLGCYVAQHILECTPNAIAWECKNAKAYAERKDDGFYKPYVFVHGRRLDVPGVCVSHEAAISVASTALVAIRTTLYTEAMALAADAPSNAA